MHATQQLEAHRGGILKPSGGGMSWMGCWLIGLAMAAALSRRHGLQSGHGAAAQRNAKTGEKQEEAMKLPSAPIATRAQTTFSRASPASFRSRCRHGGSSSWTSIRKGKRRHMRK